MAIQKTTIAVTLEDGYLKAMYVALKSSSVCEKRSDVTQHIQSQYKHTAK